MIILLILFLGLLLSLIGLVAYIIYLMNKGGLKKQTDFLQKFVKALLILTIVGYFIAGLISVVGYFVVNNQDIIESGLMAYPVILSLKLLFEITIYIYILRWAAKLLNNLKAKEIYKMENASLAKQIGQAFLVIFVAESVTGLLIAFATFFSQGGSFTMVTNPMMFMNIIIGLILLIVSSLFEHSIRIYEENKLTI